METLYIIIGAFSSIIVFLLGYSVSGVFTGKKRINDLEKYIEMVDMRTSELERELHIRIDNEVETILRKIDKESAMSHKVFQQTQDAIRSQLDSRIDKLMNQVRSIIPPTNDEVMKELKKTREDFYTLRNSL